MSSISYHHKQGDDYVTERIDTGTQTAELKGHIPYRRLQVTPTDGTLINDGSATETVTVTVVDGMEVARGTKPSNATMLGYDGDVTLFVDGSQTVKALSNGSVSFDLTTTKSAGSEIKIIADSINNHPTDRDSAVVEVTA
jgi:hypothetical protein